jgi:hypothetical protein
VRQLQKQDKNKFTVKFPMATRVPSSVPGHRAAEKSPQNPMARASAASSCMFFFMFLLGWGLVCAVVSCGTLKKYSASELLSKRI